MSRHFETLLTPHKINSVKFLLSSEYFEEPPFAFGRETFKFSSLKTLRFNLRIDYSIKCKLESLMEYTSILNKFIYSILVYDNFNKVYKVP